MAKTLVTRCISIDTVALYQSRHVVQAIAAQRAAE